MKLRLSCWAEDLQKCDDSSKNDNVFAVVMVLNKEDGVKPTILGQTEPVRSYDPDWTRTFILNNDYELGQDDMHIVISIYNQHQISLGSTAFEIGNILGRKQCALAKELKYGGLIGVRLEHIKQHIGQFHFQFTCQRLTNLDGIGFGWNKSDPYYEIHKQQKSSTKSSWDAIYRSQVIDDCLNPIFPETYLDLDIIGDISIPIKIVVMDYNKRGLPDTIGEIELTIHDLMDNINENALQGKLGGKQFDLRYKNEDRGKLLVAKAELIGVPDEESEEEEDSPVTIDKEIDSPEQAPATVEEEDVVVEAVTSSVEIPEDAIEPTFFNYVAGGCQLRIICSIDATSSNGNPRDETSLHYFTEDHNSYEQAMFAICHNLSKFDSDQRFPVYGFGAKIDGVINHCFPFASKPEVDGVEGILKAYRTTFRSGIVMSAPRDFSEVIRTAGKDARKQLKKEQTYSILLIFSNGSPADMSLTRKALKEVDDAPLSVVIVGVGSEGNFDGCKDLENPETGCRSMVNFVDYVAGEDVEEMAKDALHEIPKQLEKYFVSKGVFPQPVSEPDEIDVQPYNETADVEVPIVISETGEIAVTEDVKPPKKATNASMMTEMLKLGQNLHKKVKKNKAYGKIKQKLNKQAMAKAKQKVNKFFGTKIL